MKVYNYQVSVIIVNYNTLNMTQACINSVYEMTEDVSFEIILIDNNSQDGSKEKFEKDYRIKYIYSYENMGFGRANNIGIMLAQGEYVFLLNSDTIIKNNAIKYFYNYAKEHEGKEHNFYGSWLLEDDLQIGLSFGDEPTLKTLLKSILSPYFRALKLMKKCEKAHEGYSMYGKTCEVGYISGADLFFHIDIYKKYGAFDHNFFMYMEEAEWQKRVKSFGVRSIIIEGPKIIHLHGGSDKGKKISKISSINTLMMMRKSKRYFMKKHYSILGYIIFILFSFVFETTSIMLSSHYDIKEKCKFVLG